MNLRFPLYAKILLWFFLNLIVLVLGLFLLAKTEFRTVLDKLVESRVLERLQPAVRVAIQQLEERPREEWEQILKHLGEAYDAEFLVYRDAGTQLAGTNTVLPAKVLRELVERAPSTGRQRERDSIRRGPDQMRRRESERLGEDQNNMPNPPIPPQPRRAEPPPEMRRSRFMVRTDSPEQLWIGNHIQVPEVNSRRRSPATLLIVSSSNFGGDSLFDLTPWFWAAAGTLAFSALFWFPLVRGITRSIGQMTLATGRIAEGQFDVRVSDKRRDELGSLGSAINRMATRLDGFVNGQKRFLGDIAHELCAPIARTQMALGILEQRADDKQKAYVEDLREEVQHMSNLVNELLSFSKASLGGNAIRLQPVPLKTVVEKAVDREISDPAAVQVHIPENIEVLAEPDLLQRAISNLVRNALRYAGHAGPINVAATEQDKNVVLTVSDSGPGIPEEALQKIFDPFYRLDPSRDRETGGVGLGLAIVKTCVEACRGSVAAKNQTPSGLEVEITLQNPFQNNTGTKRNNE